ncbi:hypothetical protein, partial [Acetobacter fallax]|uniref:hypothetical protein n=1 Tax=Acetobacter fallax TaxID=1737473 RepID=UPI001A7E4A8E
CQIHASMNSCHGTGKPFTTAIIPSKPDYARGSLRMLTNHGRDEPRKSGGRWAQADRELDALGL